jgi:anti-sigma regulatory factor (Ser/Thr protein kinase)
VRFAPVDGGDDGVVTDVDWRAGRAQRLRVRCPAWPTELQVVRRRVQRWAHDHGLPEDVLVDLQLALGEAVSNGIEHAYDGDLAGRNGGAAVEVVLELCTLGGAPVVAARVSDRGRWRPFPVSPGHRGRGLLLIRRLSQDTMQVMRTAQGTQVTFAIPVLS